MQTATHEADAERWLAERHPLIVPYMRHPHVARLRRLHQLGTASVVWLRWHTRYDHSVGCATLASKAGARIRALVPAVTCWDVENLVIAALLHDIGHGPLSHTYDESVAREYGMLRHEERGVLLARDLLWAMDDVARVPWVLYILRPSQEACPDAARAVVGTVLKKESGVDVDRLDYVYRDLAAFGVSYLLPRDAASLVAFSTVRGDEWCLASRAHESMVEFGRFWLHAIILAHPSVCALERRAAAHMVERMTCAFCTDEDVLFEMQRGPLGPVIDPPNAAADLCASLPFRVAWTANAHLMRAPCFTSADSTTRRTAECRGRVARSRGRNRVGRSPA